MGLWSPNIRWHDSVNSRLVKNVPGRGKTVKREVLNESQFVNARRSIFGVLSELTLRS